MATQKEQKISVDKIKYLIDKGNFDAAYRMANKTGEENLIKYVKDAVGVDKAAIIVLSAAFLIWLALFLFGTKLL